MVFKKIKNPKKSVSKQTRISRLLDYVLNPEKKNRQEQCLQQGCLGDFLTNDLQGWKAEMIALAQEGVRSKDPISHYMLSWREGEQPNPAQVDEAVDLLIDELGLQGHQAIYALHQDTDNLHVHVIVNRVHPETLKVIKPNLGFDIEAGHRAVARIEHLQGWQPAAGRRYQVLENGELAREYSDADKPRQPQQRLRDMEHRTGEKSMERIAIEEAAPLIKQADDWQGLHRALAEKGMRYEKTGSGAVLFVGEMGIKASRVDRNASFSKLQKRLGLYEPSIQPITVEPLPRKAVPIEKDIPGWDTYTAARKAHYAARETSKIAQQQRQQAERQQLIEQHKAQRLAILQGHWQGKGALRNALQSVLAAGQVVEKIDLRDRHQQEKEQRQRQYLPYPDLEQWQRQQQHPELAEQWRYRHNSALQYIEGNETEAPTSQDIRFYTPSIQGHAVHYHRKDDAEVQPAFVDQGKRIEIHDWRNRESVLAALQLSQQKWGSFEVIGNDEYKAICVELAAEYGFKIRNPALQESIQKEQQRRQEEKVRAMESDQLKQFEQYHAAVGAERYRVTSIRMKPGGGKLTFILDKQDGVTRGFTPEEMVQRTAEMQRLERRGENLYYTPLSEHKHHILIDDLNQEKLQRLIADGYKPAVLLESSPGNYQAVLTVAKLGTPHDRDVGNRLAEYLNRRYGDEKLSGCIHPHRAPGYPNRKPQYQQADSSYPTVRLVKAERRDCALCLKLSAELNSKYASKTLQNVQEAAQKIEVMGQVGSEEKTQNRGVFEGVGINAYQRHHQDIMQRQQGGVIDASRVDSMVAVRLRVTGHSQQVIESAIRHCAPRMRSQDGGRNWNDYAQRTARYAFSLPGDRQVEALSKYRQQWQLLEGFERSRVRELWKPQDRDLGLSR